MAKNDRQLALAFFDGEPAAREAVEALKQWDKAIEDVELRQIGILAQDTVLSGPIGWGALVLSGVAGGKKGLDQLIKMLDAGLVAVAVLVSPDEAGAWSKKLLERRGYLVDEPEAAPF